jgi:type I restriction enzyme S subunit
VKCIDDEIPFEIPQGWEWCRMGNIFNHASGKQQSSNNTKGKPHQFITTSNLYWGRFVLDNVKVMNFTDDEVLSCSATKGDLLVCEGGAGYGRSAIWSKDYDICLQNHIHRLRPYVFGICEYVYYFIYLLKESNRLASVGTAMPGLSANRLKSLIIPLPPLQEQARIVAKLEEVNHLIERYGTYASDLSELNSSINGLLHKSILQEAIQGKLVPQIESEGTAQELLEQIQQEKLRLVKEGVLKKSTIASSVIFKGDDNKYYEKVGKDVIDITEEIPFQIPCGWTWTRINNVIELISGRDLEPSMYNSLKQGVPYITGASNFANGDVIVNRWTEHLVVSSQKGDILITCKGTIGEMAVNMLGQIHIARQVMAIRPYLIKKEYIYYFLSTSISKLQATANSMIPGISRHDILSLLLPLPPINEQKRIVERLNLLFHQLC